jgi:hypothetical protein
MQRSIRVKIRSRLVPLLRQKRSGPHGPTIKVERRKASMNLQRQLKGFGTGVA